MKTSDDLLKELTKAQREAVQHGQGPLLVLAGPGSGKTRVVTHRAAYLARTVCEPRHILAITFTNKAANEMAERIARLRVGPGITCRTFHSFCAQQLRIHAQRAGLPSSDYSIFDQTDQIAAMKEAIERAGLSSENFPPARMLERISRAKNNMQDPDTFERQARDWQSQAATEVYRAYQAVLAEQNALDFDDLLVRMARLLGDDPELRDRLQDQYRYVLVDEYQDTNHAQYLIVRGLALDHENLCVTGDPDQSIYGWRGANMGNILDFEEDFPQAKVIRLERNYRSTPQILAAADAVIAHNRRRKQKRLWTANPDGPPVRVVECSNARAEAEYVAGQIAMLAETGGRYGQVAVFYRVNALSRLIEAALLDTGIPYQVARGVAFYNRKEIKDTLAYLRLVVNPRDRVALLRIINVPARGIGRITVERLLAHAEAKGVTPLEAARDAEQIEGTARAARNLRWFADLITELAEVAKQGEMAKTVDHVVRHSGLLAMWRQEQDQDAIENINELITAASEYDRQHDREQGTLPDWLQRVSLVGDVDAIDPQRGAVTLMTLHAAKGLEFDTVFIVGLEDGLLPHRRSDAEAADVEEERRLLFVGMTRARRALVLTRALWRETRGVERRTVGSPFLGELPGQAVEWVSLEQDGGRRSGYDAGHERKLPAEAADYADWRQGELVRHPEHGLGRVIWIRLTGGRLLANVLFESCGNRSVVLGKATLERVEADEFESEP